MEKLKIIITKDRIRKRVDELIYEIGRDFEYDDLVVIGILTGSFIFLSDLVRGFYKHKIRPVIDFMTVSAYGSGVKSKGEVDIIQDIKVPIKQRPVLVVDDILDTGLTLKKIVEILKSRKPLMIKTCVLLKKRRKDLLIEVDYYGFEIPDVYVIGYGLDFNGRYRELPYIAKIL